MKQHTGYRNFIKQAMARANSAVYAKPGKAAAVAAKPEPETVVFSTRVPRLVEYVEAKPAAVEPVTPAPVKVETKNELEVYELPIRGARIITKDLIGICAKTSARNSGKQDLIVFRGAGKVASVPAAVLKPMARLFDPFMNFELAEDALIFRSEDNRSKTVIKSAPLERVGKIIAVDVMAI